MIEHLTEQNQRMACLLGRITGGLMMLPQLIPPTNLPAHMALEKIMNDLYASIDKIFYGEKPTQPVSFDANYALSEEGQAKIKQGMSELVGGFAVTPEKLKALLREECEHESDGVVYFSNPSQYRCVKCEVFYK